MNEAIWQIFISIYLLMSLLENATLPWGQSWERILHKHSCIHHSTEHLCLRFYLNTQCSVGSYRFLLYYTKTIFLSLTAHIASLPNFAAMVIVAVLWMEMVQLKTQGLRGWANFHPLWYVYWLLYRPKALWRSAQLAGWRKLVLLKVF